MSEKRRYCLYCGEEVDEMDWDYIGTQRVWCCGQSKCNRVLRDEHRAAYEEAANQLYDDWFGR